MVDSNTNTEGVKPMEWIYELGFFPVLAIIIAIMLIVGKIKEKH